MFYYQIKIVLANFAILVRLVHSQRELPLSSSNENTCSVASVTFLINSFINMYASKQQTPVESLQPGKQVSARLLRPAACQYMPINMQTIGIRSCLQRPANDDINKRTALYHFGDAPGER